MAEPTHSSLSHSGYLSKKKTRIGGWDRRFFRLQETKLSWYVSDKATDNKNFLPLKLIKNVVRETFKKTPSAHQASCGIKIEHHKGTYYLVADNTSDADEWVAKLQQAIEHGRQTDWSLGGSSMQDSMSMGGGQSGSDSEEDTHFRPSVTGSPQRTMHGSSPGSQAMLGSGRPSSVFSPPVVVNDQGEEPASNSQESEFEHVPGPAEPMSLSTTSNSSVNTATAFQGSPSGLSYGGGLQPSSSPRLSRAGLTLGQSGSGSELVKVPVHFNDFKFPVMMSRGGTVADLLAKIRKHDKLSFLSSSFLDSLELWEVGITGQCRRLHDDEVPDTARASSKMFFIVTQDRRLFVIHSEDGRFISTVLRSDTTAADVCQPNADTHRELADLVAEVRRPGLFAARPDGPDRQLEDEDRLSDVLDMAVDPTSVRFTVRSCMPLFLDSSEPADVLEHPTMQGWLMKKGVNNHQWQRRWCVFARGALKYFKNPDDREEKGAVLLREMQSVNEIADESRHLFNIVTPGRTYMFASESSDNQHEWARVLQQSLTSYEQNQSTVMSGFLDKKGHVNPAFKKRWFVLRDNVLLYSDTPSSATQDIPLAEYRAVSGEGMIIELVGASRKYTLRADNQRDKDEWLTALQGREGYSAAPEAVRVVKPSRGSTSDVASSGLQGRSRERERDRERDRGERDRGGRDRGWQDSNDDPVFSDYGMDKPSSSSRGFASYSAPSAQQRGFSSGFGGNSGGSAFSGGSGGGGGFGNSYAYTAPAVRPLNQQPLPPPLFENGTGSFAEIPNATDFVLPEHLQTRDDGLVTFEKKHAFPLGSGPPSSASSTIANLQRRSQTISAPSARTPTATSPTTPGDSTSNTAVPTPLFNLPPTVRFAGPVDVPTPATLRTLMLSPDKSEIGPSPAAVLRVRLSGVALQMHGGRWSLSEGQAFHPSLPERHDRLETIPLPPSIAAIYDHGQRRWYVVPAAALQPTRTATISAPITQRTQTSDRDMAFANELAAEEQQDPALALFVRVGGKRVISDIVRACETLMEYHSESTQRSGTLSNTDVMDDSLYPAVGHLVRGPFCSSLAMMLSHGMVPFRFGGLVRNTLWTVIGEACPAPRPTTTPAGQAAYRVVTDINSFQAMSGDANMKFRTFVCAALNHRFLEDWLGELMANTPLLQKFYTPQAFLRLCPHRKFDELMLALQPLAMLPFRLYSAFELGNRPDLRRGPSYADPSTPRSALPRAASVSMQRAGSVSQRGPAGSGVPVPDAMGGRGAPQSTPEWIPEEAASGPSAVSSEAVDYAEGMVVRALFDNNTEDPDELSFAEADIMEVESVVSSEWLVCTLLGQRGLVPTSYITRLESVS